MVGERVPVAEGDIRQRVQALGIADGNRLEVELEMFCEGDRRLTLTERADDVRVEGGEVSMVPRRDRSDDGRVDAAAGEHPYRRVGEELHPDAVDQALFDLVHDLAGSHRSQSLCL